MVYIVKLSDLTVKPIAALQVLLSPLIELEFQVEIEFQALIRDFG
jgi:hypothetical protein